jgi:serine/threonine protein kinase
MKPGLEIGNYVLAELLDQGGTSDVWLAYRELEAGGRTTVAIKFPHAAGVLDPRVRDGLDDEARLRMQLQHSNIPRVIDMGLHEGLPYFVMDYISGRSLAELLARLRELDTPLRFEVVAHIAREIGYALRYAHGFELDGVSRPVLHRDVAPKSVLLSRQGAIYVVGFGIAEAAGTHSSSGSAKGTPRYESPEHAMGFPTPKSDGWGLGAIMWEMIEGRPFRAEVEDDDLRRAAKQGTHDPLTREGIPEVLQQVTDGLLQVDDRERLTLDEALRLLEAPELPVQRMALADVLKSSFGDTLHRPGGSRPDAERSDASERPLAAAKVLDDGPFGLNAWSRESEDDVALPPPPAWASMDGAAEEGSEPAPAPSGAPETNDDEAPGDEASASDDDDETRPSTHDAAADPPMLAVVDLGESSSAVEPRPVVPAVLDTPPPAPTEAPRKGWSPGVVVPVLGLLVAGIAWAAWPKGEAQDTTSKPAPAPTATDPVQPASKAEPTPPVVPEPTPPVVPEPTPVEPEPTPVEPEPTPVVPEPTPVEPEPTPPEPAEPTTEPEPSQPDKPKSGGSKPPRKKVSGPPAQLAIELLLYADMELEVNGKLFTLGLRKTTAKTSVAPGTIQVRWRRPLGKWKRKTFEVDAGASYEMLVDDRGPKLRKK